eukprot:8221413-Pyramimonas_sp.AAC.1
MELTGRDGSRGMKPMPNHRRPQDPCCIRIEMQPVLTTERARPRTSSGVPLRETATPTRSC